jgi:COP9 signalosome complex subunit 7
MRCTVISFATANQASYPTLSPVQIDKLKQLSLVSLGMESRVRGYSSLLQAMMTDSTPPFQSLTYDSLLSVLDQPSVRALEDLIIDAIYAGIISGHMDQVNGRFSVDWVVGRDLDVGGSELRDLGMRLENWYVL